MDVSDWNMNFSEMTAGSPFLDLADCYTDVYFKIV